MLFFGVLAGLKFVMGFLIYKQNQIHFQYTNKAGLLWVITKYTFFSLLLTMIKMSVSFADTLQYLSILGNDKDKHHIKFVDDIFVISVSAVGEKK